MTAPPPFSFVQITDLHVGYSGLPESDKALAEDLRQIESEVGDRVAFIVATGDLTNVGSEEECRMYLEATKATRLKIHPGVGNHDYVASTWKEGKWDAAWYRKLIAPLNYSFDHNGVHFVVYDYTNEEPANEPTKVSDKPKTMPSGWLIEDLSAQPAGTPIVFLVHDQKDKAFYDRLAQFNIIATLSGHWHSSRLFHDGRIGHFNAPSLCFGGIDYSPRAYRVFTWDGASLTCETIPLKKVNVGAASARRSAANIWFAPLGGEIHLGSPVVAEGRVFLGLMDEQRLRNGAVACWDAGTGRELWRTTLDTSVKNTVAYHREAVIAVTVVGEVIALRASDGGRLWTYQLGDSTQRWMFSSPCVRDDRVFVGQGPHFAALDAATGRSLWVRDDLTKNDWISSYVSPASDGERVFIGFNWKPGSFRALDARSGKDVWLCAEKSYPVSPIVLDKDGAVIAVRSTGLCKLAAATGALLWEFPLGEAWSPAAPCVDGDRVYTASGAGKVLALDLAMGKPLWEWECGQDLAAMLPYRRHAKATLSSPVMHNDHILLGANDGRLVALRRQTGQLDWSHDFGAPVTSSPAIVGDTIFLAVRDGNLYALRAPSI